MDLVLTFDALISTLVNFCSFLIVIINDQANGLEFSKWSWPCTYPNLMFVFGVVHLEFYFKVCTLCLMCAIALFYSNPRFEFDFNANYHFE
jgi:hypothetical protein